MICIQNLMKNKLLSLISVPLFLYSCDSNKNIGINGSKYSIEKEKIVQTESSFLEDELIKFGLVSDIEGAIENARVSAKKLKQENVDGIIIAGDCYENENIRRNPLYPNSTDNLTEMFEGIKPYAELGIPIFVIPGNHESKKVYDETISKLNDIYGNVFDIKGKSVDLGGLNFVGMGGYHHPRFTEPNGFLLNEGNYSKAEKSIKEFQEQGELTVFVTHGPPKSNKKIDYVQGAGHVGDVKIAKIMDKNNLEKILNIHGHIHEGGRNGAKYNSGVALNIASVTDYSNPQGSNTGLLTITEEGKVDYKNL